MRIGGLLATPTRHSSGLGDGIFPIGGIRRVEECAQAVFVPGDARHEGAGMGQPWIRSASPEGLSTGMTLKSSRLSMCERPSSGDDAETLQAGSDLSLAESEIRGRPAVEVDDRSAGLHDLMRAGVMCRARDDDRRVCLADDR